MLPGIVFLLINNDEKLGVIIEIFQINLISVLSRQPDNYAMIYLLSVLDRCSSFIF